MRSDRQRGFTLIEVLVALIIAGIGLAALLGLTSSGLHLSGSATRIARETSLARTVLERFGIDTPVAPGTLSGDLADSFRWRSEIKLLEGDAVPGLPQPAVLSVTVWDNAEGDAGVRLTTLRLAPAPPAGERL